MFFIFKLCIKEEANSDFKKNAVKESELSNCYNQL